MGKICWLLSLVLLGSLAAGFAPRANAQAPTKAVKKVLMVVTSWDHFPDGRKTGLWLEEYAVPYTMLAAAGYEITVASPQGGAVPVDPGSLKHGVLPEWSAAQAVLQDTVVLKEVRYAEYDAIVLPGGHGPMFDLAGDADLARMLTDFSARDGIIAAVCHGSAALVNARTKEGEPLTAGRKVTGFTNAEETMAGLEQAVPFSLETRLRALGAVFVVEAPWSEHVVVDGNLITGQNPQSSRQFGKAIAAALAAK